MKILHVKLSKPTGKISKSPLYIFCPIGYEDTPCKAEQAYR